MALGSPQIETLPRSRADDNLSMLRVAALLAGACILLLGLGIVQRWNGFLPEHPVYLFAVAVLFWIAGLWRWKVAAGLIALGSVIILMGVVLAFVYPQVVDRGSGQDAAVLFGVVGGAISGLIGLTLLVVGLGALAGRETAPLNPLRDADDAG